MEVSPTLAINELTQARARAGRPPLPLGFGEAGLPVHPEIADALRSSAPCARYGPVNGIPELRGAAAQYWTRRHLHTDPERVVAGPGSKPLLYGLLHASAGSVALPRPSWVSYAAQAALLGRVVHHVPTLPGQGGVPDPELLDAVAARARRAGAPIGGVVLTLPDNPTGTLANPDTVRALCEVASRERITIISDEIYRDLVHDSERPFVSPAEVAPERTVVTSGLSKNLALGGWRIGFARLPEGVLGDRLQASLMGTASEIWSSPAHPVQKAAAWALTEPSSIRERIRASRSLHRHLADAVAAHFKAAGADVEWPTAAFFVYPDFGAHRERLAQRWSIRTSADLARILLDQLDVAALPGSAFGDPEERLSLRIATSMLYGNHDQAETALSSDHPVGLPWIAAQLDRLAIALRKLLPEVSLPPRATAKRK